jgi:lysyl-tRNA synthetase class 2
MSTFVLIKSFIHTFSQKHSRSGFCCARFANSQCRANSVSRLFCSSEASTGTKSEKSKSNKNDIENNAPQGIEDLRQVRVNKLEDIKKGGMNPFAYQFKVSHKANELQKLFKNLPNGEEDSNARVSFAGRIMARRVFGKLAFFELKDESGSIQAYIEKSRLGDGFKSIKDWTDAGDIIGVTGTVKRTDKGELSVYVNEWTMLTKSLLPLPDKYYGLTDVNKRYRQRHLDMIVNPEVREVFKARAFITSSIRRILDEDGFLEIETPILNSQPGGAEARPFNTYHNTLEMELTLRIATELHLKRLIVGGFEKVYEIGRIFRNEGLSTRHNPEFTSIELYQAYADYDDMMELTEKLVTTIAKQLHDGSLEVTYGEEKIDFRTPWRRISMHKLVEETCGVDFLPYIEAGDVEGAKTVAKSIPNIPHGLINEKGTAGEILNIVFEELCESNLIQPTFVTDHPIDISPLAKPHRSKPGLTERFELFIVGREHANAFSELTDPIDQRKRFEKQVFLR